VDILQALPEILTHFRCCKYYQTGNKKISQIGYSCTSIGWACISTDTATLMSVQVRETFESAAIPADNFCEEVQDVKMA